MLCLQKIIKAFDINCLLLLSRRNEPRHEKTNILVSDLVRHKPGCTATEDGWRLEILGLKSRGTVLSM